MMDPKVLEAIAEQLERQAEEMRVAAERQLKFAASQEAHAKTLRVAAVDQAVRGALNTTVS